MQRVSLVLQNVVWVDSAPCSRATFAFGQTTCNAEVAVFNIKVELEALLLHAEDLAMQHVYPLHNEHTDACRRKCDCLGESNGGAVNACEQRRLLQAKGGSLQRSWSQGALGV